MPDLFHQSNGGPLANRMRPETLDDVIGQRHIIGEGKLLRRAIEADRLGTIILYGPPGTGKTTLARVISNYTKATFVQLNAVTAKLDELRNVIREAESRYDYEDERTILFLDEIHRLNKSQQDALLPHVESGLLTLIGATTENPSFEVNSALLSRARVYVLKPLTQQELIQVMQQALAHDQRGLGKRPIDIEPGVLEALAHASAGDARRALGLLETACDFTEQQDGREVLRKAVLADVVGHQSSAFNKQGDAYYDLLSAIHKSIRSSRPDAALLYMARFIQGGGDPLDIVRRLTAIASEDVGNADPRALPLVIAAWDAYLRLGDYEGQRAIAHAAIHLAVAPKSNRIDRAWKSAQQFVQQQPQVEVPTYLRNAPTKLMEQLGHGEGYRYAHNEADGYPAGSAHDCWPEGVPKTRFYEPSPFGQEKRFGEIMAWREQRDQEADQAP